MISDLERQTETTLVHHLRAASIDEILSDYTEDSVLFTANGPIRGLAGIRGFFEWFWGQSKPEIIAAYKVIRQDISGEIAFLLWQAEPYILLASDTFVVRDGKIAAQTFTISMPS